jgi:hypothetical protein
LSKKESISSASGKSAILLSHVLFLRAAEESDDHSVSREATLVLEEYDQFFERWNRSSKVKNNQQGQPRLPKVKKRKRKWKPQFPESDPLEQAKRRI